MGENSKTNKILYKDECFRIQSCIFEVNKKLGSGFLEAVYQEALEIELKNAKIPYEAQKILPIYYDGRLLKHQYQADFVCFWKIIVEIKAVTRLGNEHTAQILNYLAITRLKLGLLINFCAYPKAEIIRIIR